MRRTVTVMAAVLAAASCATPALAAPDRPDEPTLEARATLPADASAAAPFAGVPNTDPTPQRGARQPVGGFSALIEAPGRDRYWAMPDNGFGAKANSRSLPAARLRGRADVGDGARGGRRARSRSLGSITLSDPQPATCLLADRHRGHADRLLTGGDFDVESVRQDRRRRRCGSARSSARSCVHTDARGQVPRGADPDARRASPRPAAAARADAEPRELERLRGHGALRRTASSCCPVLEGAVTGDDPKRPPRLHVRPRAQARSRPRLRASTSSTTRPARSRTSRCSRGRRGSSRSSGTTSRGRRRVHKAGVRRAARRARTAARSGAWCSTSSTSPTRPASRCSAPGPADFGLGRPVQDALPDDRGGAAARRATGSRSSTTRTSARAGATPTSRTTATSW